jgi:hypothetical protein
MISDPSTIATNGMSVIMPLGLLLVPLFVLLYDATQNIFLPFVVLGVSIGIMYILYPTSTTTVALES